MLNVLENREKGFRMIDQGDYVVFEYGNRKTSMIKKETLIRFLNVGECVSVADLENKMNATDNFN